MRIARIIAVGVLTVLLCLGIAVIYAGWPPFDGRPGFSLTDTGYVAMAIGLTAAILLGLGIGLLIHQDSR